MKVGLATFAATILTAGATMAAAGDNKDFSKHGITFRYPGDMVIEEEAFNRINQISVEDLDSTLILVQVYPAGMTSTGLVRDELLKGFREHFASHGANFPTKATETCTRSIGGVDRKGVRLFFSLEGLPHQTEIYTFRKGIRTIALVLQHAADDSANAGPRFEVVASTLR